MPRHKRDWKQYNKQLINRGNINLWITKRALKFWLSKKKKTPGRPYIYSDEAIKAMLVVRFKFSMPLRELQGFFESLAIQMHLPKIPSYTQVCRRMRAIELPDHLLDKKEVTDLVIDTTGLKVYGEGEWCAKRYGGKSKWLKLHVAMDPQTGKLTMAEITDERVHDTTLLEKALTRCNKKKGKVLFDGIADSKKCYEICQRHNKKLLTPPNRRAILRKEAPYATRNEALKAIRGLGDDEMARSIWAKLSGYSRRSQVESMIARWKKLLGADLKSKTLERVKNEVKIKGMVINEMIEQMKIA